MDDNLPAVTLAVHPRLDIVQKFCQLNISTLHACHQFHTKAVNSTVLHLSLI